MKLYYPGAIKRTHSDITVGRKTQPFRMYSTEILAKVHEKMYKIVHCSFVCNTKKLEMVCVQQQENG